MWFTNVSGIHPLSMWMPGPSQKQKQIFQTMTGDIIIWGRGGMTEAIQLCTVWGLWLAANECWPHSASAYTQQEQELPLSYIVTFSPWNEAQCGQPLSCIVELHSASHIPVYTFFYTTGLSLSMGTVGVTFYSKMGHCSLFVHIWKQSCRSYTQQTQCQTYLDNEMEANGKTTRLPVCCKPPSEFTHRLVQLCWLFLHFRTLSSCHVIPKTQRQPHNFKHIERE